MGKLTRFNLGEHFDNFIATQVQNGRYSSASEVVRQGLRLLEEHEKGQVLRQTLANGENSGDAGPLDREKIRSNAKRKAGLSQ